MRTRTNAEIGVTDAGAMIRMLRGIANYNATASIDTARRGLERFTVG